LIALLNPEHLPSQARHKNRNSREEEEEEEEEEACCFPAGYAGPSGAVPGYVKLPNYQCNLLWALVNYWNLYRATMDDDLLPGTCSGEY
jgi:hypothetical protein